MSIPMQVLLVVAAVCVCFSDGAPDGRLARAKQQRPTRGFKNLEMMTARGFGKRGRPSTRAERDVSAQTPPERTYRAPPTYRSPSVNYAIGVGKRKKEHEPEGDEEDQLIPERTNRVPTFENTERVGNGIGFYGKRTTKKKNEGATENREPTERKNRAYQFKSAETLGNGIGFYGKRASEKKTEGDLEEGLLPGRTNRATHVFKNTELDTAINYGKRTPEIDPEDEEYRIRRTGFKSDNSVGVAIGYGKRTPTERVYGLDNFWETLASPEREGQGMDDDKLESIPMDWFVNEIVNNPDFARSVLRKFVDVNQDGMLSSDELLRNV